jgi:uncharacterized membrane protein YeaQ/YmgE (transglycosylase-associated protein family)
MEGGNVMEGGINLKKQGVFARMSNHPVAALAGALTTALLFGVLGTAHGNEVALIVGVLGALVGAPLGAFLSASYRHDF